MKILISACLLGENCKYNGGNNYSIKLKEYLESLENPEIVPFCPECLAGFPIPREPIEYVNGRLVDKNGKYYDELLAIGRNKIENFLQLYSFDLAILKAKSPSCGNDGIYDGTFSRTIVRQDGFAVEILKAKKIKVISENDL